MFVVFGCSDESSEKKEEPKVEETALEVESEYYFLKDSSILVEAINPVNGVVNMNIKIEYYEGEEVISTQENVISYMDSLATSYSQFKDVPENASNFVVTCTYEEVEVTKSVANILDVYANETSSSVEVTINNYDDSAISAANIAVLFYDSNEIVAYTEINVSDVVDTEVITTSFPVDVNGSDILFDTVETSANSAIIK